MENVTVRSKFQIVIPRHVREKVRIEIGDLLDVGVENGKIIFTPRTFVDRHLAEGLEDLRNGRTHGPYASAEAAIHALEARSQTPYGKTPEINLRFTEKADRDYAGPFMRGQAISPGA